MAKDNSFDVGTGVDLQEVDNAVNQAMKEVAQRYDFKGTDCSIELDRKAGALKLEADDEYRLAALYDVLQSKLVRRNVPLKNLDAGKVDTGSLGRARQEVKLQQGLSSETAKEIVKAIKSGGFKKAQASIQGDQVRVSSPSRDTLQEIIALLKAGDYGVELQFTNYR